MALAIKVENLSKAYQLGQIGTGTVSRDIERWYAKMRGKEDPFLKAGEVNDHSKKGSSNIVWSLKDINFEIQEGDAVGIIGRNGAGKSTLLKILSKVTSPTRGNVKIKGNIVSLLEVGTGFHPELTGKENVYLNGAILGMRKSDITRRFDEIVDFSGVERYIDTPVKRYSSGMYVRLAFAVAAHLESKILIVDEVLAVGDAEFQQKCLGKMGDVSTNQGRTVLFVSHNMSAIQKLCTKGILLNKGTLQVNSQIETVLNSYLDLGIRTSSEYNFTPKNPEASVAYVTKLMITDLNANPISEVPLGKPWQVKVFIKVNRLIKGMVIGLGMVNGLETPVRTSWNKPDDFEEGNYTITFIEKNIKFSSGRYKLLVGLSVGGQSIQYLDDDIYIHFSDVVEEIDDSVINSGNGILLNPMEIYVEKNHS